MRPRAVSQYLPLVNQVADDFVDRMAGTREPISGQVPDFKNELLMWNLECMWTITILPIPEAYLTAIQWCRKQNKNKNKQKTENNKKPPPPNKNTNTRRPLHTQSKQNNQKGGIVFSGK